jgi:hypothetical protein
MKLLPAALTTSTAQKGKYAAMAAGSRRVGTERHAAGSASIAPLEDTRRRALPLSSGGIVMQSRIIAAAICGLALAVVACDRANPDDITTPSVAANQNAQGGAARGTTDGWDNGATVLFSYSKNFFCVQPPTSGAPSQCEVGEDGTVDPRPGKIPVLYVMTPVGFRPADSTLHCPIVGSCINHPSTIDLSRVFGPGEADVPLPAHSHIIDSDLAESAANGGQAGWWELEVIGVKSPAVWDQIVAGKSLATVRALQASGADLTDDIPTNTYLNFSVRPKT